MPDNKNEKNKQKTIDRVETFGNFTAAYQEAKDNNQSLDLKAIQQFKTLVKEVANEELNRVLEGEPDEVKKSLTAKVDNMLKRLSARIDIATTNTDRHP